MDEFLGTIYQHQLDFDMFTQDKIYFVFRDFKGVYVRDDNREKWYDYELGILLENLVE